MTDAEFSTFLDGLTPAEMRDMVGYMSSWSPGAFDAARSYIERERKAA